MAAAVTPIGLLGHTPLMPLAMAAPSIPSLVRAHLIGPVPVYRPLPIRAPQSDDGAEVFTQDITLDPGYYERGVAARHAAQDCVPGHRGDVRRAYP
ncbi:hypothetical protein [Rhodococcus aetherivorans]|uniref:hypothetical protein n=1 Tax=Rhodococcus aetherivorans TaxID=191292 RepID=UPI00163AFC9D|nr:hypothetical protein [Rhodococcus aetherivorans]MBC2592373.1 hypothetical protein [Rhodococcus aetherivorans]